MAPFEVSPSPRHGPLVALFSALAIIMVGCGGEAATPIDPADPPTTANLDEISHTLQPTEEMEDAARQQCVDDPTLESGYVKAVVPETGEVLAEFTIDCSEVRADAADG